MVFLFGLVKLISGYQNLKSACLKGFQQFWDFASPGHARLHMRGLGFTWMGCNANKYEGWVVWRGDSSSCTVGMTQHSLPPLQRHFGWWGNWKWVCEPRRSE